MLLQNLKIHQIEYMDRNQRRCLAEVEELLVVM
nr:MAG TPA: hypothetical protein [Caudoviricetes sp.]